MKAFGKLFKGITVFVTLTFCAVLLFGCEFLQKNILDDSVFLKHVKESMEFEEVYAILQSYLSSPKEIQDISDEDLIATTDKRSKNSIRLGYAYGRKDDKDTVWLFTDAKRDYSENKELGNIFIKDYKELREIALELMADIWPENFEAEHKLGRNRGVAGAYHITLDFGQIVRKAGETPAPYLVFYVFPDDTIAIYIQEWGAEEAGVFIKNLD